MANQQPEVENTPTAEENQQMEFETDLQEILSPPTIQSPPKSMEKDTIIPTTPSSPPSYSNPSPFPIPFPSSPQDSSLQDLISFTNSPSVASVIPPPPIQTEPFEPQTLPVSLTLPFNSAPVASVSSTEEPLHLNGEEPDPSL
ncbi:hypothetical protein YC2023_041218 [Brassica napus]